MGNTTAGGTQAASQSMTATSSGPQQTPSSARTQQTHVNAGSYSGTALSNGKPRASGRLVSRQSISTAQSMQLLQREFGMVSAVPPGNSRNASNSVQPMKKVSSGVSASSKVPANVASTVTAASRSQSGLLSSNSLSTHRGPATESNMAMSISAVGQQPAKSTSTHSQKFILLPAPTSASQKSERVCPLWARGDCLYGGIPPTSLFCHLITNVSKISANFDIHHETQLGAPKEIGVHVKVSSL